MGEWVDQKNSSSDICSQLSFFLCRQCIVKTTIVFGRPGERDIVDICGSAQIHK